MRQRHSRGVTVSNSPRLPVIVLALAVGLSALPPASTALGVPTAAAARVIAPVALQGDVSSLPPATRSAMTSALRRDLRTLSVFYDAPYSTPTRLILAASTGQFGDLVGASSPDVLAAVDGSRHAVIVSPTSWRGDPARLGSVLLHEASHLVLDNKFARTGATLPRWLDEGMAQFVSSDWDFDLSWAQQQKETMDAAVTAGRVVPLDGLDTLFAGGGSDVRLAYAESYSFVAYVAAAYGQRNLQRFLNAAAAPGASIDGAARVTFGKGLADLELAWMASLRAGASWWVLLLDSSNFFVFLWSFAALMVIVGFLITRYRRRRAYERLDDDEPYPPPGYQGMEERQVEGDTGEDADHALDGGRTSRQRRR